MRRFLFVLTFLTVAVTTWSQTLNITITDIKNDKGQLLLGVYTNEENYQSKEPIIWKAIPKNTVKDGVLTAQLHDLLPNTYGLALMDDEDSNWKMNFTFFIPSEGFAFSNYYHKGITEPNFNDFRFSFSGKSQTIVMKMRYI